MKRIILFVFIIMLPAMVFAQLNNVSLNPFEPYQNINPVSLINPEKLTMNHSFSVSTGYASGGANFLSSDYTNYMTYEFTDNLQMEIALSFRKTNNYGSYFQQADNDDIEVLPDFKMNYEPFENMHITFEYKKYSPTDYYTSPYKWR